MSRIPHILIFVACAAVTLGCGESSSSPGPQAKASPSLPADSAKLVAETEQFLSTVSDRVDEVFHAISAGDIQHVYAELTSPKFREVATAEKFKSICERVNTRLGPLRKKELSRSDLNQLNGVLVASATYRAQFELGSGTVFVVFEQVNGKWLLLRLNVNAPELLDDPSKFQQPTEVYVEDSEPVMPGTMVDVLDISQDPPKVVVGNVRVLNVRWKVDSPFTPVKSPAKGFVTIGLKPQETNALEASKTLSVRPHQE